MEKQTTVVVTQNVATTAINMEAPGDNLKLVYHIIQLYHPWIFTPRTHQINISQKYIHIKVYCSTIHNSYAVEWIYMSKNREMGEENGYICTMVLFNHKEEWSFVICRKLRAIEDKKKNKPVSERRIFSVACVSKNLYHQDFILLHRNSGSMHRAFTVLHQVFWVCIMASSLVFLWNSWMC